MLRYWISKQCRHVKTRSRITIANVKHYQSSKFNNAMFLHLSFWIKQFSLKKIQQIIDISINSFEKNINIINNNKRLSFFEIFFLYHTTNDFLIFNYLSIVRLHCFTNNLIIRRLCKNNQFVFVRFFVIQSFVEYAKIRFVYNVIESREITFFCRNDDDNFILSNDTFMCCLFHEQQNNRNVILKLNVKTLMIIYI